MLTTDDVRKIARLSKFNLDGKETELFRELLNEALNYIKVLDEIDTTNVEPTSQVTGLVNGMEEDKARAGLVAGEALKNAPRKKGGYFVTDVVINKNTFDL
ncbi:Asp-tRNA(Asn)/Glu-tRNA(Gln) amidotransferase subunit GatC [candidate division WWE3 bacterium]|nr:Asp-tRNA(Asn)/Glu-tRNA(Gln) amidotransferase subunit GatC [candidate division WWE3 bacterium]